MKKILSILIWIFCITVSISVSATTDLYYGIDVSNWQVHIDYEDVKNSRNSNRIHKSYSRK